MNANHKYTTTLTALIIGVWPLATCAEAPTQLVIKCLDAAQQMAIPCSVSVTPPTVRNAEGTAVTLELLGPTIQLEIQANGYKSRSIKINVASRKDLVPRFEVNLAPSLAEGQRPTLGMVRTAKSAVVNGQIDRAIAFFEQIMEAKPRAREGSTFDTNYRYWRASALHRACTTLFYDTCGAAKEANKELSAAIARNRDDFARESIGASEISEYLVDLDVATFLQTHARAKWLLKQHRYQQAREEFEDAQAEFAAGTPEFRKRTRVTSKILADNITYIDTKIRQEYVRTTTVDI